MNAPPNERSSTDAPPAPASDDQAIASRLDPAQFDAIHRALLAGLLGNVGLKTDPHEYTGARGRKFHLFPGSALFSRKPPWVMAAELTETTRLYARTVARIAPDWIERVGEHLIQRTHSEPHWNRDAAHVVAYERVTLHGLVIVPRRRVHYGPIDALKSREIFIRSALVDGEFNTDAQYFRHNRQLVRDIELLEAKLRRRDVLVDAQTRFAFYDARIPAGIFNGPLFERWRRGAEARDKRVLFMNRADLMVPADDPPSKDFPDAVLLGTDGALRLPLTYRFEPGDPADGVTATIPLAALNQLPAEPFEWLVPGWLREKVAALIKSLPRELRVSFVPVPDAARAVTPLLAFGDGGLLPSLGWHLGRLKGVNVPPAAWQPDAVPDHLRMNFRIVDESGKAIEMGRDLDAIRAKLRVALKETFAALPTGQWHRDDIARWDFDDLPAMVEVKRPGITVKGFPALVDATTSVSLRLMESEEAARQSTRAGLRRLFLLQLGDQAKHLARNLAGIERMALHYATLGPGDELRRDLLNLIADRALFADADADADGATLRTRDAFVARAEGGWHRLPAAAAEACELVGKVLAARQDLSQKLNKPYPPLLAFSIQDMRQQLAHLIPRGFVAATAYAWLRHFPRYLRGIDVRLTKLTNAGAARDSQAMGEVVPLWNNYLRAVERQRIQGVRDRALAQYRWMLEELRVSLFAQELKASIPVSVKRLEAQWAEVTV